MRHEIFHLKDFYRELGKNGCDAIMQATMTKKIRICGEEIRLLL